MNRPTLVVATLLAVALIGAGGADRVSAASPEAVYPMDETSGTTMHDTSGRGHDGTIKNIKLGVPGRGGTTAYEFNGRDSVVTVPNSSRFDASDDGRLVFRAYVNFTVLPPPTTFDIVRRGVSTTAGADWKLEIRNVNGEARARCLIRGSRDIWSRTAPSGNLADGRWHKLACEKHATTVALTVDQTTYVSNRRLGRVDNNQPITIGAKPTGDDWFEGRIDDIRISTS